jgi:hypothetical protein
MPAQLNHPASPKSVRREPAGELSAWLLDAALLILVLTIVAVAVACGVVLLVT